MRVPVITIQHQGVWTALSTATGALRHRRRSGGRRPPSVAATPSISRGGGVAFGVREWIHPLDERRGVEGHLLAHLRLAAGGEVVRLSFSRRPEVGRG